MSVQLTDLQYAQEQAHHAERFVASLPPAVREMQIYKLGEEQLRYWNARLSELQRAAAAAPPIQSAVAPERHAECVQPDWCQDTNRPADCLVWPSIDGGTDSRMPALAKGEDGRLYVAVQPADAIEAKAEAEGTVRVNLDESPGGVSPTVVDASRGLSGIDPWNAPQDMNRNTLLQADNRYAGLVKRLVEPAELSATTGTAGYRNPVPADPKIGIVICTYGSVPYVHLGLEALRLHEPNVRVLIHDDASPDADRLLTLAVQYGADFVTTKARCVPTVGDLSGFAEGLRWADEKGLDIVVKCSRRYILAKSWSRGLAELMHNTGYATACAPCAHYGFGYRSELVAMHVGSWIASGAYQRMAQVVRENREYDSLPEAYDHWRARDVHRFVHPLLSENEEQHRQQATSEEYKKQSECDYLVRSEAYYPRPDSYAAFAWWTGVMGLHRHQRIPGILWHDSHTTEDYARLASCYALPYSAADFEIDPATHNTRS